VSRPPGPPPPPPPPPARPHLSVVRSPTHPPEIKGTADIPADATCQCICALWLHQGTCTGAADLAIRGDMYPSNPVYMCQACEDDIVRQTA